MIFILEMRELEAQEDKGLARLAMELGFACRKYGFRPHESVTSLWCLFRMQVLGRIVAPSQLGHWSLFRPLCSALTFTFQGCVVSR